MSSRKKAGSTSSSSAAPAAAASSTAPSSSSAAAAEREPDYTWAKRPVYRCHALEGCQFERIENLEQVLEHEQGHEAVARERVVRESALLDASGKPFKVEGED